ncbi:MAG: hypothetical protein JW850_03170 [Thermoflexales bacterium]|nr:hypothetical protein [Thermoflexales bacterium]
MWQRGQKQREWGLIALLLLLASFCLQIAARAAIALPPVWHASTNMFSSLDPDQSYQPQWQVFVEPLRPEIMTPQAWDPHTLLTPETKAKAVVVSPMVLAPTQTSTPQPPLPSWPEGDSTPGPTQPAAPPTQAAALPSDTPLPTKPTEMPSDTPLPTKLVATPSATPSAAPSPSFTPAPKPTQKPKPTHPPQPTQKPKPEPAPKPTKKA